FAKTIHNAGSDLLDLINDILDLTKVEAGKMDILPSPSALRDVAARQEQSFEPLASQKGLSLTVEVADGAPESIVTDEQRLHQVLKNLLSNAVKFTEEGGVTLRIGEAPEGVAFTTPTLARAPRVIAFSVSDTGIGIASDKLRLIFEAFQQADGTTSRKYGGTGLGLSISREIARLLGGEIRAESTVGEGSTFTLFLPAIYEPVEPVVPDDTDDQDAGMPGLVSAANPRVATMTTGVPLDPDPLAPLLGDLGDDRGAIEAGDRTMLIVETDHALAREARDLARAAGCKTLVAARGGAALALIREFRPDAVVLDADLPYTDAGALIAHVKQDPELRHIPVHVVATADERQRFLRVGAIGFTPKPLSSADLQRAIDGLLAFVDRATRVVLVVEDDDTERAAITALLGAPDGVDVVAVASGEEAQAVLETDPIDCIVLDLKLPKSSGFAVLEKLKGEQRFRDIPVIIYTGKDLTRREETRLSKFAETIIVKDARSPERLLEETTLFLHQPGSRLPQDQQLMLEQLHANAAVLEGKQVLIVDDDVRNVFALTSVLERHGMSVLFAENGREGIAALEQHPDINLVLMDIMMPEMDGYETMTEIRKRPPFRKLPIIALTAKAMKGDRERSIAAGASDYITKPVDVDQLLSLMRVWLYG
ncbi:MAG TPA: response regulator, partial [Acidimicrobiales bacterium]